MEKLPLYTIGYGNRKPNEFLTLLKNFGTEYLIDVRSQPYSKFNPQFNQHDLKFFLERNGIKYVFMGDSIGGRPKDTSCYDDEGKVDYEKYPALKLAQGLDFILEPGDTLFMPSGYWHHMEYLDSGFAMSLRALQGSLGGKLQGVWNLFGMRNIDTLMKRTAPVWWYNQKKERIYRKAEKEMAMAKK